MLKFLKRPDVTGKAEDIMTVMGVPIFSKADLTAAQTWFDIRVAGFGEFCTKVLELNSQANILSHCEHVRYGPGKTVTQLAATALRTGSAQFLHI